MITFQQLCDFLTDNQRYSWFYFDKSLYDTLNQEEQSLVAVETLRDGDLRLFYPPEKYIPKNSNPIRAEIMLKIKRAAIEFDFDEVQRLKQLMKENE